MDLKDQMTQLAEARAQYERIKARHDDELTAWKAAHQAMIDEMEQAKAALDTAESAARDMALAAYAETEQTRPAPGVTIKLFDTVAVDSSEARTWALANMPVLLTLDMRAYEKVLREVSGSKLLTGLFGTMPGYVTQEPKATIDRDLSYLLPARTAQEAEAVQS